MKWPKLQGKEINRHKWEWTQSWWWCWKWMKYWVTGNAKGKKNEKINTRHTGKVNGSAVKTLQRLTSEPLQATKLQVDSDTINSKHDRMMSQYWQICQTASDRFGQTWTFNIPLLTVGLSAVNEAPTVICHVEESQKGGKTVSVRHQLTLTKYHYVPSWEPELEIVKNLTTEFHWESFT